MAGASVTWAGYKRPHGALHEKEQYVCFGVPSHVWVGDDGIPKPGFTGSTRRQWVFREAALLGAEAMPSPQLEAQVNK